MKILLAIIVILSYSSPSFSELLTSDDWYQQGKLSVDNNASYRNNNRAAKNIILFVGDGMGISTVTAARILDGQLKGLAGEENSLSFERFENVALSKTYNTNQQTPDSAGTMTAMMTGVKTKAGMLSVAANVKRGECSDKVKSLESFLDLSERSGKSSGIVSTAAITHATPAATYAHASERNWQADNSLSQAAKDNGCEDIASQLIHYDEGDGIDVILGGGRRDFLPADFVDLEGANGRRQDGKNLVDEWLAQSDQHLYVDKLAEFKQLPRDGSSQVMGLFNPSHMQFELDREQDKAGEPSLSEMTEFAIEHLQHKSKKKGFFLMVEAGRIDHGHHAGNAARALYDTIALSEAVEKALSLVDLKETLIIVTADHSHVMTMAGYPTRGNPILGKAMGNDDQGEATLSPILDKKGHAFTTLAYANGPGFVEDCDHDIEGVDTTNSDYKQLAATPLQSETHGGEDVAIFATGAGAHLIRGVQEQNIIFHAMKRAAKL